jgi:hypothetical protein
VVEAEVWYDQAPANDFHPGDPTIRVANTVELDELINRVREETREHRCPASIPMKIVGNERDPVLEVGLGRDKGCIQHIADDAGRTIGDGEPDAAVEYVYLGSLGEVPADSEVPIDIVRRALHEFLTTGRRPSVVRDYDQASSDRGAGCGNVVHVLGPERGFSHRADLTPPVRVALGTRLAGAWTCRPREDHVRFVREWGRMGLCPQRFRNAS